MRRAVWFFWFVCFGLCCDHGLCFFKDRVYDHTVCELVEEIPTVPVVRTEAWSHFRLERHVGKITTFYRGWIGSILFTRQGR